MNYYAMIIAYDGTDYCGWQLQPDCPTIVGAIQKTFIEVFKQPAVIVGASRTDAGVHALGQVAVCRTSLALDAERMRQALHNRLSTDILIRRLYAVDDSFHPQRNVEQKTYYYHFFVERPLPFLQRYGWYYRFPIDFEKLKECFSLLVGTHDFRSFCTGDEHFEGTVRTIDSISIDFLPRYQVYRIQVQGKSFLRYMIRRLVGACLEVASNQELTVSHLATVFAAKDPRHCLPTAPAKGLMLYSIKYKTGEKS